MPTASKLVAAILFAALAWVASRAVVPLLGEGTEVGRFAEVNAAIGAVMGWRVAGARAGPRSGTTLAGAAGLGLSTVAAMAVAALFAHSFAAMIRQSLRRIYDGPVEALGAVVDLMLRHAPLLLAPEVLATLVLGGIVAGMVVGWTGRRWG